MARPITWWTCLSSSSTPASPLPDTAWYVVAMSRSSPASSWSGLSTGIAAMVVQFGLAMMPLRASRTAAGLTSLTTRGTSGSIRHAEELSMTVTPAAAKAGARIRDVPPPAENRAMSSPLGSASSASSTVMSAPSHGSVVPAERAEEKKRISSTGKFRSARMRRMTPPTWPVAPTTPTRMLMSPIVQRPAVSQRRMLHDPRQSGGTGQRPVPP